MRKSKIFFWGMLLILSSCSQDDIIKDFEKYPTSSSYTVSVEEALQIAEVAMKSLDGETTRSPRIVSSIEVKTTNHTRANLASDSLFYLVNYADDNGFALLGADKRLPSLYAISDEGHFEFSDTLNNEGLAFYMSYIEERAPYFIEANTAVGDTTTLKPFDPLPIVNTNLYDVYSPKISKAVRKVHGYYPYNTYCFDNLGNQALTGCLPTAMAIYISYFKWPQSYKGYSFDWTAINANPQNDGFYRLIRLLGDEENLAATYTAGGTKSFYTNVKRTFENIGFECEHDFVDFDADEVFQRSIKGWNWPYGVPVLVRGQHKDALAGHAWVIDGAMKQKRKMVIGSDGKEYYDNMPILLFHCIWGWTDGKSNGYFSFDDGFLGGIPNKYDKDDTGEIAGNPIVFSRELKNFGQVKAIR